MGNTNNEIKYLKLLRDKFPTILDASIEIINLNAILNLPKGTEHFITDLHGDYDAFSHFFRNGSGVLLSKINDEFKNTITDVEKERLAILICYPKQILLKYERKLSDEDYSNFVRQSLLRLFRLCRLASNKYTKSKVRKTLPKKLSYIIEELLYDTKNTANKQKYYNTIIDTIIETQEGNYFIVELSKLFQRLTIDRLHIVGDIFDRGPEPHKILDELMNYHSIDIQWGNHDVLWMGASAGNASCIANVIRICARYDNLDILEEGYGINLLPLINLSLKYYKKDKTPFHPRNKAVDEMSYQLTSKVHQAISIIQFKLEKAIVERNTNFGLDARLLLERINFDNYTLEVDNEVYQLDKEDFPTVDPLDPYKLNKDEEKVVELLRDIFITNQKLDKHIKFLLSNGSMYLVYNKNLLFHGCIPLDSNGDFSVLELGDKGYSGKALFDILDQKVRFAYQNKKEKNNSETDIFTFLWQCENSPVFGKDDMKTFESYFIDKNYTKREKHNIYYKMVENVSNLKRLYEEFDLDWEDSKIINGHVPVKTLDGEEPVKANGRVYSIDGGLSKPYSNKTGIGGYTLRYNSYGLVLVAHDRFTSVEDIVDKEKDIYTNVSFQSDKMNRQYVKTTGPGIEIKQQLKDLKKLVEYFKTGVIKEKV
ncbi:fructose-1,6-bisphosphatase [Mycoplasmatota bacterium WC44]